MSHLNISMLAQINNTIKKIEAKVRNELGENPNFGVFATWSKNPRGGVTWTALENEALLSRVKHLYALKNAQLDFTDMTVLAWEHGRSATAVYQQLKKCRIFYTYFVKEYNA